MAEGEHGRAEKEQKYKIGISGGAKRRYLGQSAPSKMAIPNPKFGVYII